MPSLELRPEPASPGKARMFVRGLMAEWGIEADVADDAELLVTELVTNSVIHARTAVRVEVDVVAGDLTFQVSDGSARAVQVREPSPEAATGRGLFLLDRIAPEWEVVARESGKLIRFRLTTNAKRSVKR